MNLQNIEEAWRIKCKGVKAQNEASSAQDVQKELDELKLHYKRLKEEHDTFRDLADRMIEEKDKEIYKLLDDNKDLHQSLESRPPVDHNGNHYTRMNPFLLPLVSTSIAMQKQDAQNLSTSAAEQQILLLARQQAQKEEELAQSQWHILALQEEIEELECENRLHSQQQREANWLLD
ncbi:protein GRIP-like isoform X2 [Quercus robur]|uniref:protein GRIP-like isoform X2 n=1 Tax=Quercus robur TaxID=38942 RepID=UPI002161EB51|nr:protein GRIP-like isoform X2 [Quercus robur]